MRAALLRFIAGKYRGGELPLRMDRELIVGRDVDLDVVLVEDLVSRLHAKIITAEGRVLIEDLGSTNGTFVNGERVDKARLKDGDRILIGTSIMKLVSVEGATTRRSLAGTLEEVALAELLQLLSMSKKSGVLSLRTKEIRARIYVHEGQIYDAITDEGSDLPARKVIFRLLTWASGTFELEPLGVNSVKREIEDSIEALLLEGARQLDEYRRLEPFLPDLDDPLAVVAPRAALLTQLDCDALEILQLVIHHRTVRAILDHSRYTDCETAQLIVSLLERGYLEPTVDNR